MKNGRSSSFGDPFPLVPSLSSAHTSPRHASSIGIASMHRLVGRRGSGGEGGARTCRSIGIDPTSFFVGFSIVLRFTIAERPLARLFVFSLHGSMCSKAGLGQRADRACMGGLRIGGLSGASSSKRPTNSIFSPLATNGHTCWT